MSFDEHKIGEECRCRHCDKKFGNFRTKNKHEESCQTEKDKVCPECNKKYKATERLINHMLEHHKSSARLICEFCGGVYSSADSLRVHKATQHSSKVTL